MDLLFVIIEYIGIIAFTVSGAMVAIRKEADLFGVVFLSVMTAFCGGIVRDLCLGITPPSFFVAAGAKVIVSISVAVAVFFVAMLFKKQYIANEERIDSINNIFDALGLGIFAVCGTQIAIEAGQTSPFIAILMGLITGIGGGMFRDLSLGSVPFVIRKRIYAVATIAGAGLYYIMFVLFEAGAFASTLAGVLITFVLRICATVFKWNMPKAIKFSELDENK